MKRIFHQINTKVIKGLNLKQFGLFFAASFLFLMLSKLSDSRVETVTFNIQIDDLPKDVQLKNDTNLTLEAKVKSSGYGFLPVSFGRLEPIILSADQDLKELNNSSYLWILGPDYENLQLKVPKPFDVITTKSDSIYFYYDVLASKMLPINLNSEVKFALGYDMLHELTISQDSVMVIGPHNVLDSLSIIQSSTLLLKDVKSDIATSVSLVNPNSDVLQLGIEKVQVGGKVLRFTEGSAMIPVEVLNIPDDVTINYFPKEISLNYYVDLESFKEISVSDFKITCDFNEYGNSGEFYLTPQLEIRSDLVKSARINNNKVDFIFLEAL